jgi:hypothetical protein
MKYFTKAAAIIVLIVLLNACTNRGIPAIQQDALDKKISVLMVTGAHLSEAGVQAVNAALPNWRNEHLIAYEWIQGVSALDQTLLNKIKAGSYDYIYVIGNDLLEEASKRAAEMKDITSKWTLIEEGSPGFGTPVLSQANSILWLKTDTATFEVQQDNWVKQLAAQNESIEWVTTSTHPIPALWAPSEEADHIVYWDNNDQWFQQLTFQARLHASNWIVFYAPVNQEMLKKAKTLGINVKDLSSSYTADLNWEAILNDRLTVMKQGLWKSGTQSFTPQQVKEIKMH